VIGLLRSRQGWLKWFRHSREGGNTDTGSPVKPGMTGDGLPVKPGMIAAETSADVKGGAA